MKNRIITILTASAIIAAALSLVSCSKLEKPKTWYCDVYSTSHIGGSTGSAHTSFTMYGTRSDMESAVEKAKASANYGGTQTSVNCH